MPIADIELRLMNRTGEHAASQFAFAQRRTEVRAFVVHGVDMSLDIGKADDRCPDLDTQRLSWRDLVKPRHRNKRFLAMR
jgi:hypothetical protein